MNILITNHFHQFTSSTNIYTEHLEYLEHLENLGYIELLGYIEFLGYIELLSPFPKKEVVPAFLSDDRDNYQKNGGDLLSRIAVQYHRRARS